MSSNTLSRRDIFTAGGMAGLPFSWADMEAHAQTAGGERVLR